MKDLQAQREEERTQQLEVESSLEQERSKQLRLLVNKKRTSCFFFCPIGVMSSATTKRQQATVAALHQ